MPASATLALRGARRPSPAPSWACRAPLAAGRCKRRSGRRRHHRGWRLHSARAAGHLSCSGHQPGADEPHGHGHCRRAAAGGRHSGPVGQRDPVERQCHGQLQLLELRTQSIEVDAMRPSDLYVEFMCQGIWKLNRLWPNLDGADQHRNQRPTASDCAGGLRCRP